MKKKEEQERKMKEQMEEEERNCKREEERRRKVGGIYESLWERRERGEKRKQDIGKFKKELYRLQTQKPLYQIKH